MNPSLGFLPEAIDDVAQAVEWYESREPGLGAQFRRQVESTCSDILQHPLVWRERRGGYRRVNIPGFPFYLAYFLREERVLIAAVGHGSRHPDWWKRRIR
jgi:plasmid stabilization system protein ParE